MDTNTPNEVPATNPAPETDEGIFAAIRDAGVEISDDADTVDPNATSLSGDQDISTAPGAESSPASKEAEDQEASTSETKAEDTEDAKDADGPESDDDNDEAPVEDLTDAEVKDLPRRTRKRIKQLLKQRGELRDEVSRYREPADKFTRLERFMGDMGIDQSAANFGFEVMAYVAQGEDQKFLDAIMPFVQSARARIGQADTFPSDVQAMIDTGEVTEEAARRLVQERARNERYEAQARQQQAEAQKRQQEQRLTESQNAAKGAVVQWSRAVMPTDPDFEAKRPLMETFIRAEAAKYAPGTITPQVAVEIAKQAHTWAGAQLTTLRPSSAEQGSTRIRPSHTGSTPALDARNASSLEEAALIGLRKAAS